MTNREFIATGTEDKVGIMMMEMIAHGRLCRDYCKGCNESKWNCSEAIKKMLKSDVSGFDLN